MSAQPYTTADYQLGEAVVKRLHGVEGFEAWAELIAKEFAKLRTIERTRAAHIALAIDSKRGNEKMIAESILKQD